MRTLIIVALALVAGCSSAYQSVSPTPTIVRGYEVGEVRTASVGDALFEVGTADQVPMFEALREVEGSRGFIGASVPTIHAGTLFRATLRNRDDGSYRIVPAEHVPGWPPGFGLFVAPDGTVLGWSYGAGLSPDPDRFGGEPTLAPVDGVVEQKGAFRAQIMYSGLDGRTLHAVYREYTDDFIRPAFSQPLQYNLDDSNTLAFRTVQIEVLRASNTELEYRIVSDGDLPWLPR